jgi:hypothetical protein
MLDGSEPFGRRISTGEGLCRWDTTDEHCCLTSSNEREHSLLWRDPYRAMKEVPVENPIDASDDVCRTVRHADLTLLFTSALS